MNPIALRTIPKPQPGEYAPYAEMYMRLLPDDGQVLAHLQANALATRRFILALPESLLYHRYAPGKWSIKDILVHLIDDERIYAYRALRFARHEQQGLTGFDENAYVRCAEADARDLDSILQEYEAVRWGTITLFNGFPENALMRLGHGAGSATDATVRAMAYHIAGHERHHLNIIKERYLR
jgi:uncharacterized damage-inducible protein DinB